MMGSVAGGEAGSCEASRSSLLMRDSLFGVEVMSWTCVATLASIICFSVAIVALMTAAVDWMRGSCLPLSSGVRCTVVNGMYMGTYARRHRLINWQTMALLSRLTWIPQISWRFRGVVWGGGGAKT